MYYKQVMAHLNGKLQLPGHHSLFQDTLFLPLKSLLVFKAFRKNWLLYLVIELFTISDSCLHIFVSIRDSNSTYFLDFYPVLHLIEQV